MMRLGLFGGKFNPVHVGHLVAAQAALESLSLDKLWFVPVGTPPRKSSPDLVAGSHRVQMLREAIASDNRYEVSDLEALQDGMSYSVDTVRAFRARHPDADITFLLGSDVVDRLQGWKGIDELRTLCQFAVLVRAGDDRAGIEPHLPRVRVPALDISSTVIRERCLQGLPVEFLTPAAGYIKAHDLYSPKALLKRLQTLLTQIGPCIVACSGGVDSLLLATVAQRLSPADTVIAHAVSCAVPGEATERVKAWGLGQGWNLRLVESGEFANEHYVANPVNRCYYCKSSLYTALEAIAATMPICGTLLSGANTDDLGEYRPGLTAAAEHNVRHPFIEAAINKAGIRALARLLRLPFADLPASPCLASRVYSGTRVTPERLRAIESAEQVVRARTGVKIVRCRVRQEEMIVELQKGELISEGVLAEVLLAAQAHHPAVTSICLDPEPYRPGRAFVGAQRDHDL